MMNHQNVTPAVCLLLAVGLPLLCIAPADAESRPIAELPTDREVRFSSDIAPVLKTNCIACHNDSDAEGGVNLESVEKMQASDVDDILIPGKPDASRLFLLASHAEDPVMPPDDNDVSASSLNPNELALLRRWIETGAEVDRESAAPTEQSFQPLPDSLRTIYGSAITPDGRLSVVSFGNQIQLFGSASPEPLAELSQVDGGRTRPAHDDFVQDLLVDPNGRRVISTGYRNVKFWQWQPFESVSIPKIHASDTVAMALNAPGTHVATLSPRGELSVAQLGRDRWHWMKGFDLPAEFDAQDPPEVSLAVDETGESVAVGWGKTIRIVRIDGKVLETIDVPSDLTALTWGRDGQLVTGDVTGKVIVWNSSDHEWSNQEHQVFDSAVDKLCCGQGESTILYAIDSAGTLASWDGQNDAFTPSGQLPLPIQSAGPLPRGEGLWVGGAAGALGKFSLQDQKFVEIAKTDPSVAAQFASAQWDVLVGERLIAANEKDLGQAEANVTAEQKSLDTIAKEIETKRMQRDEKRKNAAEAKQAAEAAATKLAAAKSTEQSSTQQRLVLTESVKQLTASIAELEKQLAETQRAKAEQEEKLAAIPDASKLAAAVKAADEASAKAAKESEAKQGEADAAASALESAEENKARGQRRLEGLANDVQRWKDRVQQSEAEQSRRKQQEAETKTLVDQSKVADRAMVALAGGSRVLTQAGQTGGWNLWSGAGDWLADVPELDRYGELIASGENELLMKDDNGTVAAMRLSSSSWKHSTSIGSATGESPFADRVLCVDWDPSRRLLATGGGQPSRSGELMIWKLSDGSLVRRVERPHDDTVICLSFSPDGKVLASGGADRMVKLWDVETGNLIKTLEGHTHHVTAIDWHVNGRQLASGSADETVKVWDVETGKATRTISGLKSEVTRLVYVGRDDRVGITCGDGYFRVYRTDNGGRETNAEMPSGYLYALDGNRDGTKFVLGGADGTAVFVDKSGKQLMRYVPE